LPAFCTALPSYFAISRDLLRLLPSTHAHTHGTKHAHVLGLTTSAKVGHEYFSVGGAKHMHAGVCLAPCPNCRGRGDACKHANLFATAPPRHYAVPFVVAPPSTAPISTRPACARRPGPPAGGRRLSGRQAGGRLFAQAPMPSPLTLHSCSLPCRIKQFPPGQQGIQLLHGFYCSAGSPFWWFRPSLVRFDYHYRLNLQHPPIMGQAPVLRTGVGTSRGQARADYLL